MQISDTFAFRPFRTHFAHDFSGSRITCNSMLLKLMPLKVSLTILHIAVAKGAFTPPISSHLDLMGNELK